MKDYVSISIPAYRDVSSYDKPFQGPTVDKLPNEKGRSSIFGTDFATLPEAYQLTICCCGVFFFYLVYGYMQELIFSLKEFKQYGWYLTLIQFAYYSIFGITERSFKRFEAGMNRRIPMTTYLLLAFLTVATMGLSNTSLGFLNYPTQVIFKCCKLIPVMIGGIAIQGKHYTRLDFIACVCMSIGLIFFTLADSEVSPNFDPTGVLLISLALCADAVIGNVQEKAMVRYDAPNSEVVLYSYAIGFFYIFAGLLLSGRFINAFKFCLEFPMQTYGYAAIFSLSGYLGISYVLTLVRKFGALLAVTVTTCRKAVTIVLSFIFFAKPFTITYIWAGLIVLTGILMNIYQKNNKHIDKVIMRTSKIIYAKFNNVFNSSKKRIVEV